MTVRVPFALYRGFDQPTCATMKITPIIAVLLATLALPVSGENLIQIYEQALGHDARLREAAANLRAIRETRPQSLARLLPSLSVTAEMNRNSVRSSFQSAPSSLGGNPLVFFAGGTNVDFWNSAASLNLIQPIYHREYWVQLNLADKQIAEAEARFAAEQQGLIKRTVEVYFEALYAGDSLEFLQAELTHLTEQRELAQARFEAGLNAITDVHEADAAWHRLRTLKIREENRLQDTLANIELITGQPPASLDRLREKLILQTPEPASPEQWVEFARLNNPDLLAATTRVEAQQQRIDQHYAGHLPTIDLVGRAGFTDNDRPYGISTEYQAIGMQLTVPVFEGGAVNARVRQARHEYEAAREHLDGVRRTVTHDVREACRAVLSAISQIEALEATRQSTESALEAAQTGLEVGIRTMVDVLNQQAQVYEARRDHARARYDYILARFRLKWASGVLTAGDLLSINQGLMPP